MVLDLNATANGVLSFFLYCCCWHRCVYLWSLFSLRFEVFFIWIESYLNKNPDATDGIKSFWFQMLRPKIENKENMKSTNRREMSSLPSITRQEHPIIINLNCIIMVLFFFDSISFNRTAANRTNKQKHRIHLIELLKYI